jgi:transposase
MTGEQKARIRFVRKHLDFVEQLIADLDQTIAGMVEPFESAIPLLCTIPGVDRASAITIISEIGTDMSQFSSSKRLCCWAGLTPGNNQSAGKKKSVRITRSGVYLKPTLVQAAHAAVKSKTSAYYRIKYQRIAKRRGKKRAIIAIARMMLTAAYHMLLTGEAFNPCDLFQVDMPQELRNKQKEKALKLAAKLLIAQGVISPEHIALPA